MAERALHIGLGVAQAPLWAAFYASAGIGAAWWWSTAWTRGVPSFDMAQLMAPEPATPVEAYIEALDDAVCDMIEGVEDEAEEVAERVEANLEVASEVVTDVDATLVEPVVDAIAEPRLDAVAQHVPEGVDVCGSRKPPGHADDRHGVAAA